MLNHCSQLIGLSQNFTLCVKVGVCVYGEGEGRGCRDVINYIVYPIFQRCKLFLMLLL